MPYSSTSGKTFCDRVVSRLVKQLSHIFWKSHSVLDLGAGAGTYSDRYSRKLLPRGKFRWTGVEIWEPYVEKFGLSTKYDDLFVQPASDFLDIGRTFDLCFMGDIVEHMKKEEAEWMVQLALDRCGVVIMSLPIVDYPQDEYLDNPYEKHVKSDWSHEEVMVTWGHDVAAFAVEGEIGVYVMTKKFQHLMDVLAPQIGVYAICKDELKFVDRFYRSIEDADFISIIDTGSTDGTFERLVDLVKHHTDHHGFEEELRIEHEADGQIRNATNGTIQVHRATVDPWRFDDARNIALCMLPDDVDVCVSIDFDEVLEPGWKKLLSSAVLEDLQKSGHPHDRYHHRFSTIWNWEQVEQGAAPNFTDHWHERIHSRKGYMWKLPVHEVLVKGNGTSDEKVRWLHDLKMVQKPDMSKQRSSYLEMLKRSLIEDPKRWKSWSFYAGDLLQAGRYQEALDAIKKGKQIEGADQAFLSYQASQVYRRMGDARSAINELLTSVISSTEREYRVWLARLYRELDKPREALNIIHMAEEVKDRSYGYVYDPTCWGTEFDRFVEQLTSECKS